MRDEFEPLRAFARLEREWARRTQELVAARRKLAALVQSQPLTHELEADIGALRQCIARLEQQLDLSHQVSEAAAAFASSNEKPVDAPPQHLTQHLTQH